MTDLDVEIDVPDDDDLDSSVRVLNGDSIPPWLKALVVLVLGGLAALTIGAFLLGRSRGSEEPAVTTNSVVTTPIASATDSPAIVSSLEAVERWETHARTGELSGLDEIFDPGGPQYASFVASSTPAAPDVDFAARNLTETIDGDVTTVSMDLVVTGPAGRTVYPYDLVYLGDSRRVWTVIDRRAPGEIALPPDAATIDAARQAWLLFASSMSIGDGAGAAEAVSEESRLLAAQVADAARGLDIPDPVIDEPVFTRLVERVVATGTADTGQALVAMLDEEQRQALVIGELTAWTQVGPERVVATLDVAGQPVATVPFVGTGGTWLFDFKRAVETSRGE